MHHHHNHISISSLHNIREPEESRLVKRVVTIGCFVNFVLMAIKLGFGYFGHSDALVADGYHSLVDVATDILMLTFVTLSFRNPSEKYPYGFGKFETFASLLVSGLLLVVSVVITSEALESIRDYLTGEELDRPDVWTVIAVVAAIICKEFLFRFYRRAGKKINSNALVSSAWHHRSDALASLAAFIGVFFAHFMGEPWRVLDPVASLVIVIFILIPAFRLFVPAFLELMERSLPDVIQDRVLKIVESVPGVICVKELKTRKSGPFKVIDLNICIDKNMTVGEFDSLSDIIRKELIGEFGENIRLSVTLTSE